MTDDDESFLDALRAEGGEVQPLRSDPRAAPARGPDVSPTTLEARRRAATTGRQGDPIPLSLGEVPSVGPHDEVAWKNSGVQEGVYRKLRLGRYPVEATLDLHRHTVREARQALWHFVQDCLRYDVRSVLITHGKGLKSPDPARLKRYVAHWLTQIPEVLAFHTAQPRHGSFGAVYVLMRKSEARRQENAERHQKRHAASSGPGMRGR